MRFNCAAENVRARQQRSPHLFLDSWYSVVLVSSGVYGFSELIRRVRRKANGIMIEPVGRGNPSPGVHLEGEGLGCVLLTVTTEDRVPWLANEFARAALVETWREARGWLVTDYLLMPDHLHCFCFPGDRTVEIERWISFWKDRFRKRHGNGTWKFQSRGWHHRLRSGESYVEKWNYVQLNPVRKGLVRDAEGWRIKGRVHEVIFRG